MWSFLVDISIQLSIVNMLPLPQKPLERSKSVVIGNRKLVSLALVLVASSLGFAPASEAASSAKPDSSNIVVSEERIGDQPYQVSRVLVKARPEQVWQVLTDYRGASNIFSTVKRCEVLVDKGPVKIIRFQIHPTGLLASFEYNLELHEQTNKMIEWHRVSGDFKAVEGFWKLEPADCGRSTLVTYATYVNGGFLMPQAFVRHQSRIDLPQAMAALKHQSETTMHIASHGSRQSE